MSGDANFLLLGKVDIASGDEISYFLWNRVHDEVCI